MAPGERSLREGLQRVRRRWFGAVVLAFAWKICIAAAMTLGVVALVDGVSHPAGTLLVALTLGAGLAVGAAALVFAWPYRRRPDDRRVARFVEERCPECEDEIVAAVDVAERTASTGFAALVVDRASARLTGLDPSRIVPTGELRSGAVRFVLAAAALTLSVVLTAPSVLRATLEAAGRHVSTASDSRVAAARSAPPRVEAIDLHYDYPRFTGLASRDERDGGDIYAPAGTRVRMRVRADKPIAAAHVALGSGSIPTTRIDARTFEATLTLAGAGSYRAVVQDAGGLHGESVEYFIRLVADRPPQIHIVRPAGDQEITPLEEVTIEAQADDDFGIASMDMVFAVAGGPEHVVSFQSTSGPPTARAGRRLLAAEELGVKPGDVISYYARARDVPHAKPPTVAHSEIYFLEVKPFNEEYSLAESQAMAASAGTELAGLIAAQKAVISATWNLQRRSKAGSSSDDVRAVAAAQAEVKARTERAAGARPPRRGFGGMFFQFRAPQEEAGPDNVARAAAAMGRAIEQLDAGSTMDAISPEMAALTALLKAEADIRQRQITQQRNGASSFGNGRQGQDLSSLFDRELKRQQKTNYETRSAAEAQPARTEEQSALDRISDLARRQEDLARRQQAASTRPDEERRRELQRLTREQQELARQLEQAGEQPQRSGTSAGSNAQSTKSAEQALRAALEQMRNAATDLQRQNAAGAASKAAAAADQLRRAEAGLQQAHSAAAGANGETRQLADALDSLRKARDELARARRRLDDAQRASGDRGQPGGRAGGDLEQAQQEYTRALQRAQDLLRGVPQPGKNTGLAASTPEEHEWSWGAPGTEAWKQDFSKWEALGNDLGRALERSESTVGQRLSKSVARDRLRGAAPERVPDGYADRVARYYESLASVGKRK